MTDTTEITITVEGDVSELLKALEFASTTISRARLDAVRQEHMLNADSTTSDRIGEHLATLEGHRMYVLAAEADRLTEEEKKKNPFSVGDEVTFKHHTDTPTVHVVRSTSVVAGHPMIELHGMSGQFAPVVFDPVPT